MVELTLNGLEVVKDIGVVKLQIIQDGGTRTVMHELAALVEKSSVVFIGFDHEIGTCVATGLVSQAR